MKISFDLHTHTVYSHGTGLIEDNARSAKEKGLKGIAITDHGFSHPVYGMRRKKLDEMREHCDIAKKESGVDVLLGIESNIRGESGIIDVVPKDYDKLDVVLAGIHKFIVCCRYNSKVLLTIAFHKLSYHYLIVIFRNKSSYYKIVFFGF